MSTHSCNELCQQSDLLHWVQKRYKDDWEPDQDKAMQGVVEGIKLDIKELTEALDLLESAKPLTKEGDKE